MNRRAFLRITSTMAAGATLPQATLIAAGASRRKMTLALSPGSIGVRVGTQKELNALAFRHGFESVEPRASELAGLSKAQLEETLADLSSKNLVWATAGLPVDFRKAGDTFQAGMQRLADIAAGLQRAGAIRMGTWLSPSHPELTYLTNFKRHANRLREVARLLQDHGLRLGLEYVGTQALLVGNRYPFVHTLAETQDLISEIGADNVGLVLDSWHWWTANDTEADLLALSNRDIVSVDLNDAPSGIPQTQQRDNQRELPGATGVIDLATFLNALARTGYDGPVRAEPFNKALNQLDNEAACAAASRALHKAMDLIEE